MTAKVGQSTPVTSPYLDYDEWLVTGSPGVPKEPTSNSAFFDVGSSGTSFSDTVEVPDTSFPGPAAFNFSDYASELFQGWSRVIATNQSQMPINLTIPTNKATLYNNNTSAFLLNNRIALNSSWNTAAPLSSPFTAGHFVLSTVPSPPLSEPLSRHHSRKHSSSTTTSGLSPHQLSAAPSPLETPSLVETGRGSPSFGSSALVAAHSQKRKRNKHDPVRCIDVKDMIIAYPNQVCTRKFEDESGQAIGTQLQWVLPATGGNEHGGKRKKTAAESELYQINRRNKPCEKCRKSKKRCDQTCEGYIECLRAKKLVFLDRPEVVRLFRSRPNVGHPLASKNEGIYELTEISPLTFSTTEIRLKQGLGKALTVRVCSFEDNPEFKTSRIYQTSTGPREIKMPRLCLADMQWTRKSVEVYIRSTWCTSLCSIMSESSEIVRSILYAAQRHSAANPNTIVHRALLLLAVNRMIERTWLIYPEDCDGLNLSEVEDPECPWFRGIPITPVMDTQLDQIIIKDFLMPLRGRLLKELRSRMDLARKEDWFETFLVTFILCTNTELLLRHSRRNAKRYGAKRRYNSIELAVEYFHGTNIILAHFNHLHNNTSPLRLDSGSTDLKKLVGLQEEQAELISGVRSKIHVQRDQLLKLREGHHYEAEMFWSHQMFLQKWKPEDREVIDEV